MKEMIIKQKRKQRRTERVRNKVLINKTLPRLTVFRSNKHIYAQIIDDKKGKTLVSVNVSDLKDGKSNKTEEASMMGKAIADKAKTAKIKEVVFDRGSYQYHGRIKALADAAREGGLVF